MAELPELDKLLLARSLKHAKANAAMLKERLRDEFDQADAEKREPFPITPLTGIRADLVKWACDAGAAKADSRLSAVIGVQRNSCKSLGDVEVFLLSEDVVALLTAAGIVEESNAQV